MLNVYTALYGPYDQWVDPPKGDYRLWIFTDQEDLKSWGSVIRRGPSTCPPRLRARLVKAFHHEAFFGKDADTLWLDASMEILNPAAMIECLQAYQGPIAAPPHRFRTCIYQEANECNQLRLDDEKVIGEQMARYRQEGYPAGNGLHETGVLFRRGGYDVRRLSNLWLLELYSGSVRDQLSFDYCLWSLGLKAEPLHKIDEFPWLRRRPHLTKRTNR